MININQPQNTAPEPDEPEEQRSQYRQNDRRGMYHLWFGLGRFGYVL